MPERRKQAARLREYGRLARRLKALEDEHEAVTETVTVMIANEPTLDDSATDAQLAQVLGVGESTIRSRRKRLRGRLQDAG